MSKTATEIWILHTPRGTLEFGFAADECPDLPTEKPDWMLDFKQTWDKPQDPITYEFRIEDKDAQKAFDFLLNPIPWPDENEVEKEQPSDS